MKEAILHIASINLGYAKLLVGDLADAQMAAQPIAGKTMNHPAWVIGHVARSLDTAGKLLSLPGSGEVDMKELAATPGVTPAEWGELFGARSQPLADASRCPSKAVLLKALEDAHARASDALRHAQEPTLARAIGGPFGQRFRNVGTASAFLLTSHTSTHLGQLSAWRRAMGLPPVM